jgi:hypothetical protein
LTDDNPFDAWRAWAMPFADPVHAPDWLPEARPAWPGMRSSPAFRAWVRARLSDLEQQVFEERFATEQLTLDQLVRSALQSMGPVALAFMYFLVERARAEHDDPVDALKNVIREIEPRRRGPTALTELRSLEPKGLAGWDIWMMRKVIIPRFWPEAAAMDFHLRRFELARIAADRRGCTKEQALRFYAEERLASH